MKNKGKHLKPADELLKLAEKNSHEALRKSPDELHEVLHELRIHQSELEMQNDELRRVQLELDVVQAGYFDLYELAPVGYFTLNEQGQILQANLTAATLLGTPKSKLISLPIYRFILNEDQEIYYLHRKQLLKTLDPQACELRMVKSDGTPFWAHLTATVGQDSDGIRVLRTVLSDITERKQTEEELRLNDHALKAISQGVLITCSNHYILSVNKAFTSITGYTKEEILGKTCYFLRGPLTDPKTLETIRQALKNGSEFVGEILNYRKDGTTFWNELTISPARNEHHKLTHFVGVTRDITTRKQAEALKASENRYRSLVQDASDAILISDMSGNLEEINYAGEQLLGYSWNVIAKMNLDKIYPAEELGKVRQYFEDFSENADGESLETKILRKDGQVVNVEIRPCLVDVGDRQVTRWIFIDRTARNLLEKDRLAIESTHRDTLVREVHHRIKNNLQGIIGILRQFSEKHPETAEPLSQAISQVQSVAVIHGLQGRASPANVRVCELTLAIAAGIEFLWQKTIIVEIPERWAPCTIIESEAVPLALILNELISNAVKHNDSDEHIRINFSHEPKPESIRLVIHNTGLIPINFGLEAASGFGTGLQLVTSLLPPTGARLSWEQLERFVVTTVDLDTPIIHLESIAVRPDEIYGYIES
jgi:PAS domain S-box-containing protein